VEREILTVFRVICQKAKAVNPKEMTAIFARFVLERNAIKNSCLDVFFHDRRVKMEVH
jgi:hypothetical protein